MTTVLDPSYKVPGAYLKVSLGVGPASAGDAPRKVLCYGNKITAGTATAATAYAVDSVDTARTLFGAGSELARMCAAALTANPACNLYGIVVAESAGTNATGTITLATTATAASTLLVWIEGYLIRVPIASADTPTVIGDALVAAIGDWTDSPVTAANSTGTVTLTSRHKGPRGNAIAYFSQIETACGTTTANAAVRLASGATSDDPQAALDATLATRYHYHASPYPDSTNLAKFTARTTATALPTTGLREETIAGSYDTPANSVTLATTLNEARAQVPAQEGSWLTPGEVAAAMAATRALYESIDPAVNLDGVVIPGIPWRRLDADKPTSNELNTMLNGGVTPLMDVAGGKVAICRSVTTHTLDGSSNPDYRVLDTAKVVVTDYVADDLAANWSSFIAQSGAKIRADSTDNSPPPPGVTTPKMAKDWVFGRLKRHESAGLLENVDANVANLVVGLSSTEGRIDAVVPVDVITLIHQLSGDVRQIG